MQLWQPHMSKDLEVDKSWVPEEWLPALGLTVAVEMDSHAAWGHLAASLGEALQCCHGGSGLRLDVKPT